MRILRWYHGIALIMTQTEGPSEAWQGAPLRPAATSSHGTACSHPEPMHTDTLHRAPHPSAVGPSLLWRPEELADPAPKPGSLYSAFVCSPRFHPFPSPTPCKSYPIIPAVILPGSEGINDSLGVRFRGVPLLCAICCEVVLREVSKGCLPSHRLAAGK